MKTTRTCKDCNKVYPATLEYFYNNRNTLQTVCKSCASNRALEHYRANRESRIKAMSIYDKTHPEVQRRSTRKFNAIKRGVAHENWTDQELIDTYGTDCYICNKAVDFNAPKRGKGSDYSSWPDHVIPISRGGEDTIKNVRPCHRLCNQIKHNKTYDEYLQHLEDAE